MATDPDAIHAAAPEKPSGEGRFGRKSTVRAALMTTGSAYISYLAGLITTAALARTLGPGNYGIYAYFVWLTGMLSAIYNSGFGNTSIRFISENLGRGLPDQCRAVMAWLRRRYWVGLGVATIGFVSVGPWLKPDGDSSISVTFLVMVVVAAAAKSGFTMLASFGKGYGRFEIESFTTSALALVNIVGVVALVLDGAGLQAFAGLFVLLCIAHLVLAQLLSVRAGIASSPALLDPEIRSRLAVNLRWSILFALLAAFGASSIEIYLLNRAEGSAAVAYFSLALSFSRAGVNLFIVGISSTVLPILAHAYGKDAAVGAARLARRAMRYAHLLGMSIAGLGFFLAFPAVRVLYGEQYLTSVWILQCIIVAKAFTVSGGVLTALFVANDQQRGRTTILALTLIVNVSVAAALVPNFGLLGAVISSVLSGIFDLTILLVVATREFGLRLPMDSVVRLTACGLAAGIPAYVLARTGGGVAYHITAAGIFCAAYFPLAYAFGGWDSDDLSIMHAAAGRIPVLSSVVRRFGRVP